MRFFPSLPPRLAAVPILLGGALLPPLAFADEPFAFDPAGLAKLDATIEKAVGRKQVPGVVLWIMREGTVHTKAFGQRAVAPAPEAMSLDTAFDVASLTKVVATAPSIMILAERGLLKTGDPVVKYLPEFTGGGREKVTILQLLTHTSGCFPILPRDFAWSGYTHGIALGCAAALEFAPGTRLRYSDINYILLAEIVRRVGGAPLDVFAAREIFQPLGMRDTGFNPPKSAHGRIAPTEKIGDTMLRGVVHDPAARQMGGVAGHAGLFSTAADLGIFCTMFLNGGKLGETRILKASTVRAMTRNQMPARMKVQRGFGWDIASPHSRPRGAHFSDKSYGHTGWTGPSVWIDPKAKMLVLFLTNRNHPYERAGISDLREAVGTLAAEAAGVGKPDPSK